MSEDQRQAQFERELTGMSTEALLAVAGGILEGVLTASHAERQAVLRELTRRMIPGLMIPEEPFMGAATPKETKP